MNNPQETLEKIIAYRSDRWRNLGGKENQHRVSFGGVVMTLPEARSLQNHLRTQQKNQTGNSR